MEKINIRDYVGKNVLILKDRSRGGMVRQQTKITSKDEDQNQYEVIFDDKFISINSSFYLGMFEKSIQILGEEQFRKKYKFHAKQAFLDKIDACILTALVAGEDHEFGA